MKIVIKRWDKPDETLDDQSILSVELGENYISFTDHYNPAQGGIKNGIGVNIARGKLLRLSVHPRSSNYLIIVPER